MLEIDHIGDASPVERFLTQHGLTRLDPAGAEQLLEAKQVMALSPQFWGEHCTECAAPDCHATCDLFERGPSGRCRRLAGGVTARFHGGVLGYTLEAVFKPWGQLMTVGNTLCLTPRKYRRWSRWLPMAGWANLWLQGFFRFLPGRLQWRLTDKLRGLGNRLPRRMNRIGARRRPRSDRLLCIFGNPAAASVAVEVTLSGFGDSQGGKSFRTVADVSHGWHALEIPVDAIEPIIDLDGLFRIALVPQIHQPVFLQIGYVGFISVSKPKPKIKLVVTDLDHTLWDGVLIEEPDRVFDLKPGVREAIETLDRRGILLSIASKNNPADAQRLLETLDLWEYFLFPQIDWAPKSENIRRIAHDLNIGLDAVAFIDDSPFERAEVASALPKVTIFKDKAWPSLPMLPRFDVPVTEDARKRRRFYRQEADRRAEEARSGLDYEAFLASCNLQLELLPLCDEHCERIFELVQRTNQLNFSGRHYTRREMIQMVENPAVLPIVLRCRDRFGDYGIVGFALVLRVGNATTLRDLMLSCRIQGKKVEHALLAALAEAAASAGPVPCRFRYRPTPRNTPAGRVFADLGLARVGTADDREIAIFEAPPDTASFPQFPLTLLDRIGLREALTQSGGLAAERDHQTK